MTKQDIYNGALTSAGDSHLCISLAVFKSQCDMLCSRCLAHGWFNLDEANPTSINTQCVALLTEPRIWYSWFLNHSESTGRSGPLSYSVVSRCCCNIYKQEKQVYFLLLNRLGEMFLHFFLPGEHLRQKSLLCKSFFLSEKNPFI